MKNGLAHLRARIDAHDQRFERIENNLVKIDKRFERIEDHLGIGPPPES